MRPPKWQTSIRTEGDGWAAGRSQRDRARVKAFGFGG